MKNMRLNRVKKKLTTEERFRKAFESLPKWQQEFFDDVEYVIQTSAYAHDIGYDINPKTGRRYTPRQLLYEQIKSHVRGSMQLTKREIYNKFRMEERPLYNKYNSYIYRTGNSAQQYFINNSTIKVNGSIVSITVHLPPGKRKSYDELVLEYDYSTSVEAFITAYMR